MKKQKTLVKTFSLVSQLGISVLAPVILCTWAGLELEKRFALPLTIPLIVMGVLAGGRNAYVLVQQTIKEMAAEKDEDDE